MMPREKEECSISEDRAAQGCSERVAILLRAFVGEFFPCIQLGVAKKLEQCSVETVRPRLGHDVQVPAGFTAELSAVVASLHAHFGNRVHRRGKDVGFMLHLFSRESIKKVLVVVSTDAVNTERTLPGGPLCLVPAII